MNQEDIIQVLYKTLKICELILRKEMGETYTNRPSSSSYHRRRDDSNWETHDEWRNGTRGTNEAQARQQRLETLPSGDVPQME